MLSESEQHYFLKAVKAFGLRMIVISPDFKILASNSSPAGMQIGDTIGKLCHEVFYERQSPCLNCAVVEAAATHKPALCTNDDESEDLGKITCFYAYPIFANGQVEAFASMEFNLPIHGGIENRLQRTNIMLRNLIESSVDAVIAADRKGNILVFNDAATKITGYSRNEVLETGDIRDIYTDDQAYKVMQDLRSDEHGGPGKLKSYRVDVMGKDGQKIPISLNASIVYEDEREVATIGFFHDLREELKMEAELKNTQLELLQSEKMASLGKLSAGVAHQLNNPLGGITLYTNLVLEDYELEEEAREDLHRVIRDAERCRDTVKELLEFTRQTRHFMKPNDLNQAITRTLFLLERQPLFHNIAIKKDLSETLPLVTCDLQQMNHVIMNLILNAAQAMDGRGALSLNTAAKEAGKRILFEISDTGPGIPPDILPRIFEPYFTTKKEGQGTGLGLSLVYRIIENHNGHIQAKSTPGEGTTFTIEMPATINFSGDGNDD